MPLFPVNANNYTAATTRPVITIMPPRVRDVVGRLKVSMHQNIYEADFEYGTQPLRWENTTANTSAPGSTANIVHMPGMGGVRMLIGNTAGDLTIRQSRPYQRYQPGKTMYMASAVNFSAPVANNVQRVGMFDDGNGIFFEQGPVTANNPAGIYCVIRSDAGSVNLSTGVTESSIPVDTRYSYENWVGDPVGSLIDWTRIQMLWIEYAWYGAGAIRWGTFLNGEPYVLHEVGIGNGIVPSSGQGRQFPWARTGNLPVRYEQRNLANTGPNANSVFVHYGVSVLVEGRQDDARGFTYSYGNDRSALRRNVPISSVRYPVTSVRMNQMAVVEFSGGPATNPITSATNTSITVSGTPWTANQFTGRAISFQGSGAPSNTFIARVLNNTTNSLNMIDILASTNAVGTPAANVLITPSAGYPYQIGLVNRGQILPQTLIIASDSACLVELIVSTAANPVSLTGSNFVPLNTLGSNNSLASRDVSATALTGGEVVYSFSAPSGGSGLQTFDLNNLFALYNNIRGNSPDILTVAVSTPLTQTNVGAQLIAQEAMS